MKVTESLRHYVSRKAANFVKNFVPRCFPIYKSWSPNKRKVEIEITTNCNLGCPNCDRSCSQAPSNEYMSLEQIESFVAESLELGWNWEYIAIIGGEPTLHPFFFEILESVKRYQDEKAGGIVEVVTNGYGSKTRKVLSKLPGGIGILNSSKKSSAKAFETYNIAPADLVEYSNADFSKGCQITATCGLGLTRYGYYPCGAGASVDRVFGFDIGLKSLARVNDQALKEQLKKLCAFCGHYKSYNPLNSRYKRYTTTKQESSLSWEKAYQEYRKRKPVLSLYT